MVSSILEHGLHVLGICQDKPEIVEIARSLYEDGFKLLATGSTCKLIAENGIPVERVNKLYEGRPNIVDYITNGQIQLIINSPAFKSETMHDDSYLRKAAIKYKVTYITTMAAAKAAAEGIRHHRKKNNNGTVRSLQEWHKEIK